MGNRICLVRQKEEPGGKWVSAHDVMTLSSYANEPWFSSVPEDLRTPNDLSKIAEMIDGELTVKEAVQILKASKDISSKK
jgi:hypothetical protein